MTKHAIILALCFGVVGGALAQTATGLQRDVIFTDYAPLSQNRELLRRTLSPQAFADVDVTLVRAGGAQSSQPIDLNKEHFVVYVPPSPPPAAGYALLVFVPPWDGARMPEAWQGTLDEHNMIFVSAAQSGNDQNVIARRVPLAVLAEINIARRHRLDATRIYVGGFSGGSRAALRVALAYPDVFDGAFLNAGSDPIGTPAIPLPPADLFQRFQENTRLYYATGANDVGTLGWDASSLKSMRDFCVLHTKRETVEGTTHELASARVLSNALAYLDAPPSNDPAALSACRAGLH